MRDLTSPHLIHFKAVLLLALGVLAGGGVIAAHPTIEVALLLVVAIWAFARLYYYAFYVIEHYVDPSFKYRGLLSAVQHVCRIGERTRAAGAGRYRSVPVGRLVDARRREPGPDEP